MSPVRQSVPRAALSLLALLGCAPPAPRPVPPPPRSLASVIDSIISEPPLHRTHWGILLRDRAGRTIYSLARDRHFIPASNTKLTVTAAALGLFGPDHSYETPVHVHVEPGDTIAYRIVVVGAGDPTMSARFHPDEFTPLDSLAAIVAGSGITFAHELVIDASRFDASRVNSTWEVGDLTSTTAAPVGAFVIGEGGFSLERAPGSAPGEPARLFVIGGNELQPIRSTVTTDTAGGRTSVQVDILSRRDTLYLSGSIALDEAPDTVRLAVSDPDAYAGRAFASALRKHGVAIAAVRVVRDTAEARLLDVEYLPRIASWTSALMADILSAILQPSQNWMAEQVLRTLGALDGRQGSWQAGLAVERRYLIERAGIDSLAFSLHDASGLSAQNLLTPEAIVQLLEHTRASTWGELYRNALAAPGLRGSTLSGRLRALEGRVFAKTGTISNVNSLSGFLIDDRGNERTFSILTNGSGLPSATVRRAIDAIVTAMATTGDTT